MHVNSIVISYLIFIIIFTCQDISRGILIVNGVTSKSTGLFSLFGLKWTSKLRSRILAQVYEEEKETKHCGDSEDTDESFIDSKQTVDLELFESLSSRDIDLLHIVDRVFRGSDSHIEKYRRLLVNNHLIIISFPNWFLGWKNNFLASSFQSLGGISWRKPCRSRWGL